METHNFYDYLKSVRAEILDAFKDAIKENGKDGVWDIKRYDLRTISECPVESIQIEGNDVVFILNEENDDFCVSDDFSTYELGGLYDSLCYEVNKH